MNISISGFNGERLDPVSGTTHLGNGYRAYNLALMRFNCPDSMSPFSKGGINPYVYCAGDPVNRADPSGHISGAGIAGIVMGALGLLMAPVTAGQSLTAMSCLIAGLEIVSGATAIVSGALEESNPQVSSTLGWVSFATGMVSLSAGGWAAGARKMEQLTGKLRRINGRIGIPLTGEFRNARFLGTNRSEGRVSWNIRFEDNVPLGRRLTVMMGTTQINGQFLPLNEVWQNGRWVRRPYSASQFMHDIHIDEHFYNVYRLIMPNANARSTSGHTLVSNVCRLLPWNTPVVGFRAQPRATGIVADYLSQMTNIASTIESNGQMWRGETAEYIVGDLSARYGNEAGAITFESLGTVYPAYLRFPPHDASNW